MDMRVLVDNRHRIGRRPHTAGARGMERRAEARQGPGRELPGISPRGWVCDAWLENMLHGSRGNDPFDKLDTITQGFQIGRVTEIGMVDVERSPGARSRQADATLGAGELQAGRDPEEPGAE